MARNNSRLKSLGLMESPKKKPRSSKHRVRKKMTSLPTRKALPRRGATPKYDERSSESDGGGEDDTSSSSSSGIGSDDDDDDDPSSKVAKRKATQKKKSAPKKAVQKKNKAAPKNAASKKKTTPKTKKKSASYRPETYRLNGKLLTNMTRDEVMQELKKMTDIKKIQSRVMKEILKKLGKSVSKTKADCVSKLQLIMGGHADKGE